MTNQTSRPTNAGAEELLGLYFPVLDHGFVSLLDYMGTDQCIERAARISYGAGTRKSKQTRELLRYLMCHRHSSPSELVNLKFHMCAPIFVLRQFFRHRTLSANEYSSRYSLMPMLFYTPNKELFQTQSQTNKQGRGDVLDDDKYKSALDLWSRHRKEAVSIYEDLISGDVARELARIDLPLSTYSQLYFTMNLRNLFHFLSLRTDLHAQYEIRAFADVIAGIVKRVVPISYEAWVDYDLCGKQFSRIELMAIEEFGRTGSMSHARLIELGLSKREADEYIKKTSIQNRMPDFELDLTQAKTAEYFEQKMLDASPSIK